MKRSFYIPLSLSGLLLGLALYLTLRSGTYLHLILGIFGGQALLYADMDCAFFNLPDLFWAFSLCCALHAVLLPSIPLSVFTALTGCGRELFQLAGWQEGPLNPLIV